MSTKHDDPCLQKAGDDEPIFVLRAQDMIAPDIVRYWAGRARANGLSEDKYRAAIKTAEAMEAWPTRKLPD